MISPKVTDYRLSTTIIDDMSKFLKEHPLEKCTSPAEYQQQVTVMVEFFNKTIHSNGMLSGDKNPAYDYFARNSSVYTGSQTVSTDNFIKLGNILKSMGTIKSVKDKERIKGQYYVITRDMLGGSFYGTRQGFM